MQFRLLNTQQVSERIGCSEVSLARMRCQGSGPRFLKIGRSVKYRLADVEEWLATCERQSTSEAA